MGLWVRRDIQTSSLLDYIVGLEEPRYICTMKGPDEIFNSVQKHFRARDRRSIRVTFRRMVREYYIHNSQRVYSAGTGRRIDHKKIGAEYKFIGNRLRKINKTAKRPRTVGRPRNIALQGLVHRLGGLWALHTNNRTTISYRKFDQEPTRWELFAKEVLEGLGHFNYRKYLEIHSKLV